MALAGMDEPMVRRLCASGLSIRIFGARDAIAYGIDVRPEAAFSPYPARLRQLMAQLKCGQPMD
jgi:hypothetical protein